MLKHKKSVKVSLVLTYVLMVSLAVLVFTIAMAVLIKFRKLLLNLLADKVFESENVSLLFFISVCMIIITVILLFSGYFYMPFWVAAAATAVCALTLHVMKNIVQSGCTDNEKEEIK